MNFGFIKLHRKILEWEWANDPATFCLFAHLLLKANFENKKWRGVEIRRGELITGRSELAKTTGLSEQQVRTALERLKSTSEITIKTTNRFSIINLTNYGLYQENQNEINQQNNQLPNQQTTNNQPTNNQQSTTTKEIKEYKERKEVKEIINNALPVFIDKKLLADFAEMRKKIKKPLTERAYELLIGQLKVFESNNAGSANVALQNSIMNCWQGIFEPKVLKSQAPPVFLTKQQQKVEQDKTIYSNLLKKYGKQNDTDF